MIQFVYYVSGAYAEGEKWLEQANQTHIRAPWEKIISSSGFAINTFANFVC